MIMSDNIKGAILMMLAMGTFVVNDAFMREALQEVGLYQAIFLRGVCLTGVLVAIAWQREVLRYRMSSTDRLRIYLRTAGEVAGTFLFLTALTLMPFANISAVMQVLPLTVALGAVLFMGASIGWRRMVAILLGFAGVMIIIRPGTEGFSSASLLVLLSVLAVTVRDLASRALSPDIPSTVVAVNATLVLTGVSALLTATQPWESVSTRSAACLAAAGLCLSVGYITSVAAMRVGDITAVAPFRYTAMIWAILIGVFAFGETPDAWTIIGAAVIVAMGVFSFYRERRLQSTALSNQADTPAA